MGLDGRRCGDRGLILHPSTHPLLFSRRRHGVRPGTVRRADIAQLVERNLAKVEVASSSLVVRSEKVSSSTVEWPRGEATDCKSVYTGSNPVSTSIAGVFDSGETGDWRSGSALP